MPQSRPILSFPEMHPGSRRREVPGLSYLDPGLAPEGPERFVPESLPLSRAEAKGWLSQAVGFAGLFKKPGELVSAYASGGNDFYSDTAHAIVSELRAMDKPAAEESPNKGLTQAQAVLLLAWQREQALLEIGGLDNGVEASWDGIGKALGLEDDDADELAELAPHVRPDLDTSLYPAPDEWRPVLEAMLRLIPADAALYVDDPGVLAQWLEQGLAPAPAGVAQKAGLPEGEFLALSAPDAVLLGSAAEAGASERLVLIPAEALDAA